MAKKVYKDFCGFKFGEKVDVLHCRDGRDYFVGGFTVLDPSVNVMSAKGEVRRVLKPKQEKRLGDHVPVCIKQGGRCIVYHVSRVRRAQDDAVTFASVFGTALEGGIVFKGMSYDEADDLTLGVDNAVEED